MKAEKQMEFNDLLRGGEGLVQRKEIPFTDRKGLVTTVMDQGIGIVDGVTMVETPCRNWQHVNDQSFVEMNFMLEGAMLHSQGDLFRRRQFIPGYHNLLFNPAAREESELRGTGKFRHLAIHIEKDRAISFFTEYIPQWHHLAEKIRRGDPFVLHGSGNGFSPKMNYLFDTVWSHPALPGLSRLHFESFSLEILALTCDRLLQGDAFPPTPSISRTDRDKLHYAKEILLDRLKEPPMLRELAEICGLNEFKLKKGFKQLFGCSVLAFINENRLNAALVSIHSGEKTISEIAYEFGYAHPQHFHRSFKQRFGKTPKSILKSS